MLCKYMKEAYTYLERNDHLHYYAAVTDITMELKWSVKSGLLDPVEADEMKTYFWGKVKLS